MNNMAATLNALRDWLVGKPHVTILEDNSPTFLHFRVDHTEGKMRRSELRSQLHTLPGHYLAVSGSNVGIKEYKVSPTKIEF